MHVASHPLPPILAHPSLLVQKHRSHYKVASLCLKSNDYDVKSRIRVDLRSYPNNYLLRMIYLSSFDSIYLESSLSLSYTTHFFYGKRVEDF